MPVCDYHVSKVGHGQVDMLSCPAIKLKKESTKFPCQTPHALIVIHSINHPARLETTEASITPEAGEVGLCRREAQKALVCAF